MSEWKPEIPGYGTVPALLSAARAGVVDWDALDLAGLTGQLRSAVKGDRIDMAAASDLVSDLAELLNLKAASYLPSGHTEKADEEDEESGHETMLERLMEYRAFRQAALGMEDLALRQEEMFCRLSPEVLAWEESLRRVDGVTLEQLLDVLASLLAGVQEDDPHQPWVIEREELPLPAVMDWLQSHLEALGGSVELPAIFAPGQSRSHIVATFLALLEMVRAGRISLSRDGSSGEIYVSLGSAVNG